jgi:hypothetical protein
MLAGATVEVLEGSQGKLESVLKEWLQARI